MASIKYDYFIQTLNFFMNGKTRQVFSLLIIFSVAFLMVFFIRKSPQASDLISKLKGEKAENGHRAEIYDLQDQPSIDVSDVEILQAINRESATLVEAVLPSVVSIDTAGVKKLKVRNAFGQTQLFSKNVEGQGSGVIVTKQGHVLTNFHVVQDQLEFKLTFSDGSEQTANFIGADPRADIAVLKINGKGPFQPLKFGNSTDLKVGHLVFALGSPFGLGESVTDGRVSAKKRSFNDSDVDLIQTSAAINPGNSGGPLVNTKGEIIGINSRIYSTDEENPGFQGISFAIPSNDALKSLEDILSRGKAIRGYLGIGLANVRIRANKGSQIQGVKVTGLIPNSPAMQSGLLENDIIINYNDEKITNMKNLIRNIQRSKVGNIVPITVMRKGQTIHLNATIGDADNFINQRSALSSQEKPEIDTKAVLEAVGLYVRNPSAQELAQGLEGVIVTKINPNSTLSDKLRPGDVIRAINGMYARNSESFLTELAHSVPIQNTEIYVLRDQLEMRITLLRLK